MDETRTLSSVESAFKIMGWLIEQGPAGASELGTAFDMPTSTAHHYLQTLNSLGLIINRNGAYKVSTRLVEIGNNYLNQLNIYKASKNPLRSLAHETGEFATLIIREEGMGVVLCMERGEKVSELEISHIYPGTRTPLHSTAAGKAILASMTDERRSDLLSDIQLEEITDNTIVDRSTLETEIDRISDQGYALDTEERFEGLYGIGVPIHDRQGGLEGAISLYGPKARLGRNQLEGPLHDRLREVANVIQVNINY